MEWTGTLLITTTPHCNLLSRGTSGRGNENGRSEIEHANEHTELNILYKNIHTCIK
jgi:hypothetical protein